MARIFIDHRPYEVDSQHNLLQVCLSLGINLPYFCWHPALGSVGACRQCAIKQFKNEHDQEGYLVMACMTPAAEGTHISIDDPEAKVFRASVIEWLMANHPHDCPVCDEGGECHLQDMTVMTGHTYRRYSFTKRTFRNQDLGPFITHEMNRCIQCYRCVRFYRDYAGGRDFNAFGSRNHVYFGRQEDGVLENAFSGNLIEVCPTGVFDDKTLQPQYTRKWDLQTAPSVCVHCSLGCNTIPGERAGILRRIMNRFNSQVNGYFLCDRGRFGYAFVNSDRRIRQPRFRPQHSGVLEPLEKALLLQRLAQALSDRDRMIGIGSPRASLEANFALRALVGPDRFYTGVSDRDQRLARLIVEILGRQPTNAASISDVERADALLVLGEDLINTAPRLALAVRQAVREQPMQGADKLGIPTWHDAAMRDFIQTRTGPLFVVGVDGAGLEDVASAIHPAAPDDVARLGFAVAHLLNAEGPSVPALSQEQQTLAQRIVDALQKAERPVVISGTGCKSAPVIQAAATVAWALARNGRAARLCYSVPECNSMGLAIMGGHKLEEAFEASKSGSATTIIILENDLYRRTDKAAVDALFEGAGHVIVLDHVDHATASRSDTVLPVGTFAEADGTFVNNEGRAQRFYQVFVPEGDVQESWRWCQDLAIASGRSELIDMTSWKTLDDVLRALSRSLPVFQRIREIAPTADFRLIGQKIPRETHRVSGRTAIRPQPTMHEPKPPDDPDSPLAFSMEGYPGQPPSALIPHYWAPSWNSVQSLNKYQSEVGGPLRDESPGIRLIEPSRAPAIPSHQAIPQPFDARDRSWLILPIYHLFGSDELSRWSPPVASRMPEPYLALHPDDAVSLGVTTGDHVALPLVGQPYRFSVTVNSAIPHGTAGLAIVGETGDAVLPQWSTLARM